MIQAAALALAILTLVVCVFALVAGRTPERIIAALVLASIPIGKLVQLIPSLDLRTTAALTLDGLYAFAMLGLTLRYGRPWLGLVMLLYACQFGMHAYFMIAQSQDAALHTLINNGIFLAVLLSLLAGTINTVRQKPA